MNSVNVGKLALAIRKTLRMSQTELGEYLGLHQTAVCRMEKGAQNLTAPEFIHLLRLVKTEEGERVINGILGSFEAANEFLKAPKKKKGKKGVVS